MTNKEIIECAKKIKAHCKKQCDCRECILYCEEVGDCGLDYTNCCIPSDWEIKEGK